MLGWQEVHTLSVLLHHGKITHTEAVIQYQQLAAILNYLSC